MRGGVEGRREMGLLSESLQWGRRGWAGPGQSSGACVKVCPPQGRNQIQGEGPGLVGDVAAWLGLVVKATARGERRVLCNSAAVISFDKSLEDLGKEKHEERRRDCGQHRHLFLLHDLTYFPHIFQSENF